jgi:hypothetical protein
MLADQSGDLLSNSKVDTLRAGGSYLSPAM